MILNPSSVHCAFNIFTGTESTWNESFLQHETGTPTNKRLHKLLYNENLLSRFFKTKRIWGIIAREK
jgi:hypothetical protein